MTDPRTVRRLGPILAAAALALAVLACDGDDPQAPVPMPYDLSEADSVAVALHINGIVDFMGDLNVSWLEVGTRLDGGVFSADPPELSALEIVSGDYSTRTDSIHIRFDRASGDIEHVYARHSTSSVHGGGHEYVEAHDVPMYAYEISDGDWSAVWRLDADLVCAALDTVAESYAPPLSKLLDWTCAGSEEAWLEIRVKN